MPQCGSHALLTVRILADPEGSAPIGQVTEVIGGPGRGDGETRLDRDGRSRRQRVLSGLVPDRFCRHRRLNSAAQAAPVRADGGRSCARKGCHVDAPEDWFIPVCSHRSLPTASAFTRQGQPQQPPDPPFHVAYPAGHEPPQAPERRVLHSTGRSCTSTFSRPHSK